jgi:Tol biopolymer transport system component
VTGRAAAAALAAAALLTTGGAHAAFPGRNGLLVVALERAATVDLYTVDPRGGAPRPLTHSVPVGNEPAVSPDGRLVAFIHRDAHNDNADAWIMRRDGSRARPITRTHGQDEHRPTFSPDGRLLAWLGSDDRIVVASLDGAGQRVLPPRNVLDYSWTPGGRLSFIAGCRMRTVAADGSDVRDGRACARATTTT